MLRHWLFLLFFTPCWPAGELWELPKNQAWLTIGLCPGGSANQSFHPKDLLPILRQDSELERLVVIFKRNPSLGISCLETLLHSDLIFDRVLVIKLYELLKSENQPQTAIVRLLWAFAGLNYIFEDDEKLWNDAVLYCKDFFVGKDETSYFEALYFIASWREELCSRFQLSQSFSVGLKLQIDSLLYACGKINKEKFSVALHAYAETISKSWSSEDQARGLRLTRWSLA